MTDPRTRARPPRRPRRAVAAAFAALCAAPAAAGDAPQRLHYAVNLSGDFDGVREVGFNLGDVGSAGALDGLPDGLRGVLWLGNGYNTKCEWRLSDAEVTAEVEAARGHPRFSGIYYISDEPHPSICPDAPEKVAERSALIRALDPDGRTFILVQNGAKGADEFALMGDSADYIGIDPYPCNYRNGERGCDLKALRARIETALAVGIAPERIVPVYQTFGQACAGVKEPYYRMPSVEEMQAMLAIWDELAPPALRPFDMAYSWGPREKSACPTLKMADGKDYPDLRGLFARYFADPSQVGLAAGDD